MKPRARPPARSSNSSGSGRKQGRQLRLDLFINIDYAREKTWQAIINLTLEHGHGPFFSVNEVAEEAGLRDLELVQAALEQLRSEKLVFRHGSGPKYKMTLHGLWVSGLYDILSKAEAARLAKALAEIEREKKEAEQLRQLFREITT